MENTKPMPNQQSTEASVKPQAKQNSSRLFIVIVISVLSSAVVTGVAVYFWQKSVNDKVITNLGQRINSLEGQLSVINNNVKVTSQPTLLSAQTPLPTSDTTADWKTYQNEDVTFKYPSLWKEEPILIQESGFIQKFKDPEDRFSLTFSSIENYNQVTKGPYTSLYDYINMPYKVKAVTVDGQQGRQPLPRAGGENINSIVFFSKDPKFIYTLELQTGNTSADAPLADVKEGQQLFSQIISSFRFTK